MKEIIEIFIKILKCINKYLHQNNNITIYMSSGIGNGILFTPAIRTLRLSLDLNSKIILRTSNYQLYNIFKQSNLFDKVLLFNGTQVVKNPIYRVLKIFIDSSKFLVNRSSIAFHDFHSMSSIHIFYSLLSGVKDIYGQINEDYNEHKINTNLFKKIDLYNENQHESKIYFNLLKLSDYLNTNTSLILQPALNLTDDDNYTKKTLSSIKNIGLVPGSSRRQKWKRWHIKNYIELIDELDANGFETTLFGSRDEYKLLKFINSKTRADSRIVADFDNITDLYSDLSKISLLVTNDSGLMHLASALNIRVLGIFGPTNYKRTHPIGLHSYFIKTDLACQPCYSMLNGENIVKKECNKRYCLDGISVENVFNKINLILGK